jgi:hypothetical protein
LSTEVIKADFLLIWSIAWMTFTTMLGTGNWCSAKRAKIATPLPDWAMSVALVHGGARTPLPPTSNNDHPVLAVARVEAVAAVAHAGQ